MTVSWQSPPSLLQIVRERVHPEGEEAYGRVEKALARLCRGRAPNRYLALASIRPPRDVWWLNMHESRADVERVTKGYASDPELLESMRKLAEGKKGLTDDPVEVMATFRRDLSDGSPWQVGELRFTVVREIARPVRSSGAVFELPDGRAYVFAAADSMKEAIQAGDAQILEVRPKWSYPQDSWVAKNPELWKR